MKAVDAAKALMTVLSESVGTTPIVAAAAVLVDVLYTTAMMYVRRRALVARMAQKKTCVVCPWRVDPSTPLINRSALLQRLHKEFQRGGTFSYLLAEHGSGATSLLRTMSVSFPMTCYVSLAAARSLADVMMVIREEFGIAVSDRMPHGLRLLHRVLKSLAGDEGEADDTDGEESVQWLRLTALVDGLALEARVYLKSDAPVILVFDHVDEVEPAVKELLLNWAMSSKASRALHIVVVSEFFHVFASPFTSSMLLKVFPPVSVVDIRRVLTERLATLALPPFDEATVDRIIFTLCGCSLGLCDRVFYMLEELACAEQDETGARATTATVMAHLEERLLCYFHLQSRPLHLYTCLPMGDSALDACRLAIFRIAMLVLDRTVEAPALRPMSIVESSSFSDYGSAATPPTTPGVTESDGTSAGSALSSSIAGSSKTLRKTSGPYGTGFSDGTTSPTASERRFLTFAEMLHVCPPAIYSQLIDRYSQLIPFAKAYNQICFKAPYCRLALARVVGVRGSGLRAHVESTLLPHLLAAAGSDWPSDFLPAELHSPSSE